ncbi:hypothetical protein TBLA_0I00160 [Henningerozyma blattae CBS 6284]|uniref:Uncharacterized protein n=1 Tax=Henningerozyma blattae (strain ATCC 34711 / CBS 6284 / DSM 70876 / NBRC 10599 / NRRL Y-10934 / UCD 77-7) TaxID=1071380 RepID=I2H8H9_HENB6|nr:hypothetical protein TBLA_0I00160 [Tetrapisispora blattae CBS 6284]CCH62681.1 hypothetical protein TBLA_0I00160 [Tetrapisispora blattae CBS 6284]
MEQEVQSSYPLLKWPASLDIPLKASEEVVSIDLETDLPDNPSDLKTLLVEEGSAKEHWLTIAAAYCNQGKLSEGIKLAQLALDVFEHEEKATIYTFLTWAHLNLAKQESTTYKMKDEVLSKAEEYLKHAITLDPTWVSNMLATVDLYYERGHYDKALETVDLFIKGIHADDQRNGRVSKPNSMFVLLRAKLLYQKKQYAPSLKLFQELLVINPSLQPDPRIGIGLCFWQLKDHKMAKTSWERCVELDPKNTTASILVLLSDLHDSLTSSKNDDDFVKKYTDVLKDLNNLYSSSKPNPVLLTVLQSYFYLKGDYQKVLDIYNDRIAPMDFLTTPTVLSDSTFWCGRAFYSIGDYRNAFTMFQTSLKYNEDNLLSKFGISQTQIKNNLLEESILSFENIYKTHEGVQELNYILGMLYSGKCLDPKLSKHISTNELNKQTNKAISFLEKYIKLTLSTKNRMVIPRAYLIISQLYETQNQYKLSMEYLLKVMEQIELANGHIPLEILNNIGCFHFINGDYEKANDYFQKANDNCDDDSYQITIDYNIARTTENHDTNKASELYENILNIEPSYLQARMRNLYCKFAYSKVDNMEVIDSQVNELMESNKSELEMRSFFSWYIKNKINNANLDEKEYKQLEDVETNHNRETLTKYDSHDAYSLISLGNLYWTLGVNNKANPEKSKQSFLKGIQLFQKVLQVDPLNIFAAQGLAIIFAQSKRLGPALEILRKVRDSLDNEDVHINLGHCLLEMNDFAKAIESYEYVLKRYESVRNNSSIYNILGHAWYLRGNKEKKLMFFQKALQNSKKALKIENNSSTKSLKKINTFKFNIALLEFQIAETLRKSTPLFRTSEDIKNSLQGLEEALKMLVELKDNSSFKFASKEEIEQRIQLGNTTMKSALERCLKEQEEYENEQSIKIENAKKIQEENLQKIREQKVKEEEEQKEKLARQEEEYKKLQDQAQKYIQERAAATEIDENDIANDELSGEERDDDYDNDSKKRKRKVTPSDKKSSKRSRKNKKKVVDYDDEESDSGANINNDEEDDVTSVAVPRSKKGKRSTLSNEFIDDSDDDIDASVLQGEEEESQISKNEDEDEDEDGLF